jgi:hypothetical protein
LVSTIHTHNVFYDDSGIVANNDQVTIQDSYLNRIITKYFKEFSADLNIQSIGIVVWIIQIKYYIVLLILIDIFTLILTKCNPPVIQWE